MDVIGSGVLVVVLGCVALLVLGAACVWWIGAPPY
jgi:hypothetical protein